MQHAVSVFDLDHTLTCQNVSFAFGKHLYRKKYISSGTVLVLAGAYMLHKLNLISSALLHSISFRYLFSGARVEEIEAQVMDFLDHHFEGLLRPFARSLIEEEAQRGSIVLLSNSPSFLVNAIGKRLNIPHSKGTQYKEDGGFFSGVELVLDGDRKLGYLKDHIKDIGAARKNITVYSDSILDLPLFEFAGRCIAVAPDRPLRRLAKSRGWIILEA